MVRARSGHGLSFSPMKSLITGGCGYVGTKLTEAMLARTPHDVTVLDVR